MSIELDWSTVDYQLTRSVHQFLSTAFASTALPDFVGPISLDHFSFGDEQPHVQILDITDIDKQFLVPDDDDENDHDQLDLDQGQGRGGDANPVAPYSSADELDYTQYAHAHGPPFVRRPPRSRSHSPAPFTHTHTADSHTHTHLHSPTPSHLAPDGPAYPSSRQPLPAHAPSSAPSPSFQLLVRVSYSGNLSLALSTSLRINYPSPAFMALPLQLSLTDLAFEGVLVVAFEGGKNRVHISLVEAPPPADGDSETTPLRQTPINSNGARPSAGLTAAARAAAKKERFLRSAHVESQVGNADKHVLRNVGKVEKFVLDVARTTLENELVFPNFQTILF
ncbi:hypothetical protein JCM10908_002537 [Rhodotorula pacifica]|uniref:ERMES complex subunit MDM12 n=1 Tax=Rhodotorula pacifica TaxID=1495444 RepID=UPI00317383F2